MHAEPLALPHPSPRTHGTERASDAPDVATRERFEAALRPLMPALYRACLLRAKTRDQAEDLLQRALMRAYVKRASFQGRGSLQGWLLTIIRHEDWEQRRSQQRRLAIVLDWLPSWGQAPPSPEALTLAHVQCDALLAAIKALPDHAREVILLCDLEELTHEQAAQALGLPLGTLKSRHARARARLARALSDPLDKRPGGEP